MILVVFKDNIKGAKNSTYLRVFDNNGAQDKSWMISGDGLGNYTINNSTASPYYLDVNSTDCSDYVRVFNNNYKVDKYWSIIIVE